MYSFLTGDTQTRPNPFYFSLEGSQTPAAQHTNSYLHPIHSSVKGRHPDTTGLGAGTATPVNQNLNIDEKMLAKLLLDKGKGKKRNDSNDSGSGSGAVGGRIASWAGPVSVGVGGWANDDDEGDEEEEESEISEVAFLSRSLDTAKSKAVFGSASADLVPPKDWGKKEKDKERARFDNLVIVVDDEGRLVEEEMDSEEEDDDDESGSEYGRRGKNGETNMREDEDSDGDSKFDEEEEQRREAGKRRSARSVAKGELKRYVFLLSSFQNFETFGRRRSFHDLDTFRALEVLSPERMKIDVELCGQCLIMWRRETHLRNVVDFVRVSSVIILSVRNFNLIHKHSS